jgi:chemotaxis protein histidine kinase CheA
MAVDQELKKLFLEETAANCAAALRALFPDRDAPPPGPRERATVVRAFHILAGTAGLVGHADWGRLAAAAEVATRRWLETGAAGPSKIALIRGTLNAVAAFAEGKASTEPRTLLERWREKGA